jgi:hypothetical protein
MAAWVTESFGKGRTANWVVEHLHLDALLPSSSKKENGMTLTRPYNVRDPETRKPTHHLTQDVKAMGDIDLTYYLEASCGSGSPIPVHDVLQMRAELEMRRMPKAGLKVEPLEEPVKAKESTKKKS